MRLVGQKKERVEYDRLGEGDGENSVHQDGRKRTGIAPDGRRHSETGKSNSNAHAHGRKADVNASAHFCQ